MLRRKSKENKINKKKDDKPIFYILELKKQSKGITLVALVITIIVMLILAGISLNAAIGENGIISQSQKAKINVEESEIKEEILIGIAQLDEEYYQKATVDSGINIYTIYGITELQKYVKGKVNGFSYNQDTKTTTVYYTTTKGSYTVKMAKGKTTVYTGLYVVSEEKIYINMSTESENNTVQLTTDLEKVEWSSSNESIATVNITTGEVTKLAKGNVKIEGKSTSTNESVYIIICDEEDLDTESEAFAKTVKVIETIKTVDISATLSDNVEASIVIDNKGETVLKIHGTGKMFDSVIEFDGINYEDVTNIVIEDNVKNITANAFNKFTKAKSITIASTIENIDYLYLQNQSELKTINFNAKNANVIKPDNYNNYEYSSMAQTIIIGDDVEIIPSYMFYKAISLTNVNISEGVTTLGDYSFSNCKSLTKITIPKNVTSIGKSAFSACTSLTKITILGNIATINDGTFSTCTSLTKITIPESVTAIGYYAFWFCTSLKEINIPESVTTIGYYAFWNCTSLKEITIPKNVTNIDYYTFENCTSLEKVTISEGVTNIHSWAFSKCTSLTEITIPKSINMIEVKAFENCTSLSKIFVKKSTNSLAGSPWGAESGTTVLWNQ